LGFAQPEDRPSLRLGLKHRRFPLLLAVQYTVWDDTGVLTRTVAIVNQGGQPLRIDEGPLSLPAGETFTAPAVAFTATAGDLDDGATIEFIPEVCNHWMVGDHQDPDRSRKWHVDPSADPGWWDFMFRVAMSGQFGISSRVFEWRPELRQRARENVALYKRIRQVIAGADVYHLTPPPAAGANPTGWMGLQYVSGDGRQSVLLAYRLLESEAEHSFRLRGLKADARYNLRVDGQSRGTVSGKEPAAQGFAVSLPEPWRAQVIELHAAE